MTQKNKKKNQIKYKAGFVVPTPSENNLLTPERVDSLLKKDEPLLSDAELLAKELLFDAQKKGLSAADIVKSNEELKKQISAERTKRKRAISGRNIVITEAEANELFKKLSGEAEEKRQVVRKESRPKVKSAETATAASEKNLSDAPVSEVSKPKRRAATKIDELSDTREFSVPRRFKAPKTDKPSKKRTQPIYESVDLSSELVLEPLEAEQTPKALKAEKNKKSEPSPSKKAATESTPNAAGVKPYKVFFCCFCVFLLLFPLAFFALTDAGFYALYDGGKLSAFTFSFLPVTEQSANDLFGAREEDRFTVGDMFSPLFPLKRAEVERAFPVYIKTGGTVATVYVTAGMTVAEAIERSSLTYNEYDLIAPTAETALSESCEITIQRVTLSYRTVFEEMKSEKVVKPSPLLPDGEERVMNEGQGFSGSAYYDYVDRFVDGVYYDTETVGVTVEEPAYNEVTLLGDSTAAASPIDGSKYTDVIIENGVPSSYISVTESAPCTAYSFKPGVYGSSGMRLVQGMVAVDPDKYNYGDLLYITSSDGSFVYGWAIAADACEAAMWGIVEIDCFFETYKESVLFGKRYLNVYVVDTLTKEQLEEYKEHEGMFNLRVPD